MLGSLRFAFSLFPFFVLFALWGFEAACSFDCELLRPQVAHNGPFGLCAKANVKADLSQFSAETNPNKANLL
jgi:hypothetical protein